MSCNGLFANLFLCSEIAAWTSTNTPLTALLILSVPARPPSFRCHVTADELELGGFCAPPPYTSFCLLFFFSQRRVATRPSLSDYLIYFPSLYLCTEQHKTLPQRNIYKAGESRMLKGGRHLWTTDWRNALNAVSLIPKQIGTGTVWFSKPTINRHLVAVRLLCCGNAFRDNARLLLQPKFSLFLSPDAGGTHEPY